MTLERLGSGALPEAGVSVPFVSVIVATRGRPASLILCLRSILENDYPRYELIVVDQSDDDIGKKLAAEIGDPRLTFVRTKTKGKERAQNAAFSLSKGDILLFTDDDCTVPVDWVWRTSRTFVAEPRAAIVYGA